ncbi:hypothetical protein [Bdellovibrio sp. HCB209]|uniref:hypothetical protein n=1 Tax=Bdellovibrio sp. HCB209 TaxID=3394354 RepID=UPI0039B3C0CC
MKHLIISGLMIAMSATAFAGEQCQGQAESAVKKEIATVENTSLVGWVNSIQLQPGEETFFDGDEAWNSEKFPVVIHLLKLETSGISYNVQVKLSVSDCKVLSIAHSSVD